MSGYLLRIFPATSCYFFSSRRRHTRWPRDWSSDVCSSDLLLAVLTRHLRNAGAIGGLGQARQCPRSGARRGGGAPGNVQIGRASCRERVERSVGAVTAERKSETIEVEIVI